MFLYRSVVRARGGAWGGPGRLSALGRTQETASSPSTPARSLILATDLYKNTVVCLFLVNCVWVRGCTFNSRIAHSPHKTSIIVIAVIGGLGAFKRAVFGYISVNFHTCIQKVMQQAGALAL